MLDKLLQAEVIFDSKCIQSIWHPQESLQYSPEPSLSWILRGCFTTGKGQGERQKEITMEFVDPPLDA